MNFLRSDRKASGPQSTCGLPIVCASDYVIARCPRASSIRTDRSVPLQFRAPPNVRAVLGAPTAPKMCTSLVAAARSLTPNAQLKLNGSFDIPTDIFHDASCVSKSWHEREATRCPGRMSSMPHSSASHQSSAVREEAKSTIGAGISVHLTRCTRSLQLPSASASSVTITVFSRAELSKSTAALIVRAQCITSPRASTSCATVASGLPVDTKITVPARV